MMCKLAVRRRQANCVRVNPLSSNIHLQILQTDLHTFPLKISWDQSIFPLVITFLVLITFSLCIERLGENWCWSLLDLKGLPEYGFSISQR